MLECKKDSNRSFSFFIIASWTFRLSFFVSKDLAYLLGPMHPVALQTLESDRRTALSISTFAMKPEMCQQIPAIMTPNRSRQARSPCDESMVRNYGNWTAQPAQFRQRHTERGQMQDLIDGPLTQMSPKPSYQSCIQLEVSLRSTSSFVCLDKLLCICLGELDATQITRHRSSVSLHLTAPSTTNKQIDTKGYGRLRVAISGYGQDTESKGTQAKRFGLRVQQTVTIHRVYSKADDLHTQHCNNTLGLLSFRGPSPSNTKVGKQKANADEATSPTQGNFKHRKHSFNISPVDFRSWGWQLGSYNVDGHQGLIPFTEPPRASISGNSCHYHSQLRDGFFKDTHKALGLREALQIFRPGFISRSQGRVRRLEQKARRRRSLQDSNHNLVQDLKEDRGRQKRKCTIPDPLSDNLFKPRERSISGREMQLRSRRIYNKLPEVTKKKEEEIKRAAAQTNRLRAEVFKKKLLEQILQQ